MACLEYICHAICWQAAISYILQASSLRQTVSCLRFNQAQQNLVHYVSSKRTKHDCIWRWQQSTNQRPISNHPPSLWQHGGTHILPPGTRGREKGGTGKSVCSLFLVIFISTETQNLTNPKFSLSDFKLCLTLVQNGRLCLFQDSISLFIEQTQ